mmetsp:Transcript_108976/g.339615  ORF Transcript_108976/g.339615 Transcript_108976/m.339615 type:complete len:335 (-) Transcript_108976:144-1148(-)
MGLPLELQSYAENFYRRFPEEFIALGMPGLEDVFDLRPNGTWSKRMSETPVEKTVEITIRRWQIPTLAPPQGLAWHLGAHGVLGSQLQPVAPVQPPLDCRAPLHMAAAAHAAAAAQTAAAAQAAAVAQAASAAQPGQAPPAIPAATAPAREDQAATQRLMRLESALTSLKPQIEALLAAQASAGPSQGRSSPGGFERQLSGKLFASEPPSAGSAKQASMADGQDLRMRRNKVQLQISTSAEARGQERNPPAHAPPPVVRLPDEALADPGAPPSSSATTEQRAPGKLSSVPEAAAAAPAKQVVERQRPRVDPVRVAPSPLDPASPRSPGRYSAWK